MSAGFRGIAAAGLIGFVTAVVPAIATAQFPEKPTLSESALSNPALKPPAGADVAIVEFDDLECPACGHANPILMQDAKNYKVPWVRHDFLIPGHVWSRQAAINARWFDAKSPQLGADYRNTMFAQQEQIATMDDMNQATQKFAQQHGIAMPFAIDPQGKLAAAVQSDVDLAHTLGLNRTPTIFVVTRNAHAPGYPFVMTLEPDMVYAYLDQAIAATKPQASAKTVAHHAK